MRTYKQAAEALHVAWINLYQTIGKEFGIYKFLDWLNNKLK
jgi:hypothetical protein